MFLKIFAICTLALVNASDKQFGTKDIFKNIHKEPPLPPDVNTVTTKAIQERWFDQPLNHFNPFDRRRWQMVRQM